MAEVVDNPGQHRFEIVEDVGIAVLEYRRTADQLVLVHTGVPKDLEGNGFGGALVRAAVDAARAEGLAMVPQCPYAKAWIEKHPDAVEGITVVPVG